MEGWGLTEPGGSAKEVTGRGQPLPRLWGGSKARVDPGVRRREGEAGAPGGGSWEGGGGASQRGVEDVPAELEAGAFAPRRREWHGGGTGVDGRSGQIPIAFNTRESAELDTGSALHRTSGQSMKAVLRKGPALDRQRPGGPESASYHVTLSNLFPCCSPTTEDEGGGGPRRGKGQVWGMGADSEGGRGGSGGATGRGR